MRASPAAVAASSSRQRGHPCRAANTPQQSTERGSSVKGTVWAVRKALNQRRGQALLSVDLDEECEVKQAVTTTSSRGMTLTSVGVDSIQTTTSSKQRKQFAAVGHGGGDLTEDGDYG